MRIIAGELKGRRLKTNPGMTTRPLLDRVKQMLFDRIEADLGEAHVLDIFAGTGNLGFEALSRGASTCVFIEQDRKAHQLLKENTAHLGIEDRVLCWRTDALSCSYRPKGVESFFPFDVVFFDPPYPLVESMTGPNNPLQKALARLASDEVTAAEIALLIVRLPKRGSIEVPPIWVKTEFEIVEASMRIQFYEKHTDLED
ncbi:MAG: 16S rRNA (guanine(966)-N(2))-methyltransferase RsmD [Planctomycetaceae bacterium]|nr:16S rRNA (guanine(966)-N(2))-methyltransferase RsmD [Planctomycetaceae bacterium]